MDIKKIHEDLQICVIDKPAGVTVNKSETTIGQSTIQDWVKLNLKLEKDASEGSDFFKRSGIVHRLDKETSGILLIAKTEKAFYSLQEQFKNRKVTKTYLSLVHGKIIPQMGEINVPVGRLPWNRKQFGIIPGGRESKTLYKVLGYYYFAKLKEALSFVELYPQSGRTHQIRVHLKYTGHPVFSDYLYAGRKTSKKDRAVLKRVFLHASKISFKHPKSGKQISFESNLPQDLKNFLSSLQ